MSDNQPGSRTIGRSNARVQKQRMAIPWIWEGVLAAGAVTLLSAPEKIGKTTLLSLLLDRRRGGGQLLGRTVEAGKTILCSEENEQLWALRQPPLDFGPDLIFHRPGGDCPTRGRWKRFIDDVLQLTHDDPPFELLVIDTAMSFMPLADRNKRIHRWALAQVSLLFSWCYCSVLILNQSRNVHRPLAAFADVVIDMEMPRPYAPLSPCGRGAGREGTRRRTFTGVGRYPGTMQTVSAELNAEGTDYILLPESPTRTPTLLSAIQALLAETPTPLTRVELLARWPGDAPPDTTLWRTLSRGVELGLFVVSGAGTKADALRYAVAHHTTTMDHPAGASQ